MPGPVALRRRQYYGFPGNHFWPIIEKLFAAGKPLFYFQRIRLLKASRIALWDVIGSCEREGAADSAIQCVIPNKIPQLLKKYPNIRKVFVNGKTAQRLFQQHFGDSIRLPVAYLPSTSPAHAAMSFQKKLGEWAAIRAETTGGIPGSAA